MKEKDLEKCIDKLIIKGLMLEAEQDNAEFETAMREMSDEDFLALIYDTVEEPLLANEKEAISNETSHIAYASSHINLEKGEIVSEDWEEWDAHSPADIPNKSNANRKGWKIWTAAIASVAAILLIVFVPAYKDMESRLCESALLASETYSGNTRGNDISSMSDEEVKSILPTLEKQYSVSVRNDQKLLTNKDPDNEIAKYYLTYTNPQEAGIELVQAYLKLNRKDKAVDTLRELADSNMDPEFREYCKKLLEILE